MQIKKLFYANDNTNFGDILNVDIFKKFNIDVEYASKKNSELVAIGSLLDLYLCNKTEYLKRFRYKFYKPVIVWSTGFIKEEEHNQVLLRKLDVRGVRGYKTLNRLKNLAGVKFADKVSIGDGGLLISHFFDTSNIKKKFSLGIIRHYIDEETDILDKINIKDSTVIDIMQKPEDFIQKVAECDCIVSSAMHGLICADSLGIPNIRIIKNKLIGGNYKFEDYYSAFDIENHNFIDLNNQTITDKDLQYIYDNYNISREKVKNIQKALLETFPYESDITVTEISN